MNSEYIKERPKSATHAVPSPWMRTLGWNSRLNQIKMNEKVQTYPSKVTMNDIPSMNCKGYYYCRYSNENNYSTYDIADRL
jgi:hypothetical protein